MAVDPHRQRRQDRPPVGRDPALALVTGRAHRNHEVLHQKRLVSLEARAWRDRPLITFSSTVTRGVTLPRPRRFSGLIALRRLGALVHAARSDVWTTLQAFQTRDLFAQFGGNLLQRGDFTKQFQNQSFKLCTA